MYERIASNVRKTWGLIFVFIVLTVLAFNFFGDGMRDAADPYASK